MVSAAPVSHVKPLNSFQSNAEAFYMETALSTKLSRMKFSLVVASAMVGAIQTLEGILARFGGYRQQETTEE